MKIKNLDKRGIACDGVLDDCYRMQRVLSRHYILDISEIHLLWSEYSNSVDGTWLAPFKDDEFLLEALMKQLSK